MGKEKYLKISSIFITVLVIMMVVLNTVFSQSWLLITNNREKFGLGADNTDENVDENIAEMVLKLSTSEGEEEDVIFNLFKPEIKTEEGAFAVNGDALIREAVKVLDTPYDHPQTHMPDIDDPDEPTLLDCSALVYWAMSKVANSMTATEGFVRNNPRSCFDWLNTGTRDNEKRWTEAGYWTREKVGNEYTNRFIFKQTGDNNNSVRDTKLTYLGNDINVLKINDPITNDLRYWEYYVYDENGNAIKKELPMGAIVVSYVSASGTGSNHAWIYIGDIKTENNTANEVRIELANMLNIEPDDICSEEEAEKYFIKANNSDNTHWLVETTGSSAHDYVTIDNRDYNTGDEIEAKVIGTIWAFQVANDVETPEGEYSISIGKKSEDSESWFSDGDYLKDAVFEINQFKNNEETSKLPTTVVTEEGLTDVLFNEEKAITITKDGIGDDKYDLYTLEEKDAPEDYDTIDLDAVRIEVYKKLNTDAKKYEIDHVSLALSATGISEDIYPNESKTLDIDYDEKADIGVRLDGTGTSIAIEVRDPKTAEGYYKMNIAKESRNGSATEEGSATFEVNQYLNEDSATPEPTETKLVENVPVRDKGNNEYREIQFNGSSDIKIEQKGTDTYVIYEKEVTGNYYISPNWNLTLKVNKVINREGERSRYVIDHVTVSSSGNLTAVKDVNLNESVRINTSGEFSSDINGEYVVEVSVTDSDNDGIIEINVVWTNPQKGGYVVDLIKKEINDENSPYKFAEAGSETTEYADEKEYKEALRKEYVYSENKTGISGAEYKVKRIDGFNIGPLDSYLDKDFSSILTYIEQNHLEELTNDETWNSVFPGESSVVIDENSIQGELVTAGEWYPTYVYVIEENSVPNRYQKDNNVYFIPVITGLDEENNLGIKDVRVYYATKDENGSVVDESGKINFKECNNLETGLNKDNSTYIIAESSECKFRMDFNSVHIVFTAVDRKIDGQYDLSIVKKDNISDTAVEGLESIINNSMAGATYSVQQYVNVTGLTSETDLAKLTADVNVKVKTKADGSLEYISGYIKDENGKKQKIDGSEKPVKPLFEDIEITDINTDDVYVIQELESPFGYIYDGKKYYVVVHKTIETDEQGNQNYVIGVSEEDEKVLPIEMYWTKIDSEHLMDEFSSEKNNNTNKDGSEYVGSSVGTTRIDYDTNTIIFSHLNKQKDGEYSLALNKVNSLFKDEDNYKTALITDDENLRFDIKVYKSMKNNDGIRTFSDSVELYNKDGEKINTTDIQTNGGKIEINNISIDNQAEDGTMYYFVIEETSSPEGFTENNYQVVVGMEINNIGNDLSIFYNKFAYKLKVTKESEKSLFGELIEIDETDGILVEGRTDGGYKLSAYIPNTPIVDLALKKTITKVNNVAVEEENGFNVGRESGWEVDTTTLKNETSTNATYTMNKTPVKVKIGDEVEYSIRIFNEGRIDARASKIKDYIPTGVEVVDVKYVNTANETSSLEQKGSVNGYSYDKENGVLEVYFQSEDDLIPAYDIEEDMLSHIEILVTCKVQEKATGILTNIAEITEYEISEITFTTDVDSTANNWKSPNGDNDNTQTNKSTDEWRNYSTGADGDADDGKWHKNFMAQDKGINDNNGDDDDFDKIIIEDREFDLSLRKFITKVNEQEIENSREPQIDSSKLASGESTTAEYVHTKEPLLVSPQDIVEYTIRIYNEGEVAGYANLVMDDIPEGVEMLAPGYGNDNTSRVNADYRWKMYKKAGDTQSTNGLATIEYNQTLYIETTEQQEAELIVTDYLSEDNGKTMMTKSSSVNPNLIQPFNTETGKFTGENYRDIKVEFKVKPSNKEGKIITNYAQITDDADEYGNSVVDRDSTPNKWVENEDDQDIENITVRYFDLALYKWVSTAIVTENGKTIEYGSDHTATDKSTLMDIVIEKDKLNKVTVKFRYQIRVENQGDLGGYAKEIKDHIPEGLKFIKSDNKEFNWKEEEDGTITTDYLKDTLLKPGETAEVTVILTWINSENNLGSKVNPAEISEDYNDYGAPDIDSTPNNFEDVPREDDEDEDEVILQVRTGTNNDYILLYIVTGVVVVAIILVGVIVVRKYVLEKR